MLTTDALNSALPLTEVLDVNNLALMPIPGTPLEALVKATRSDEKFVNATGGEFSIDLNSIEYIANAKNPVFGASPHDIVMDDVVQVTTKAVQGHITFAKTVVAPAVSELVEKTMLTLRDLVSSSLLGMEVVVWSPPKPLENSALETAVRRFEEVPFDSPALRMRAPSLTVKEIVELMGAGSSGLDGDIQEWAAQKGETFFINIWEQVFQIKQAGLNDRTSVTFRDLIENRESGVDNALAIFLLARKLADGPLPGTEMDLRSFETTAVEYRNQAGARLCRALDELALICKNEVLIRSMSGSTTVVNAPVYRKWIEAGGENEILFGNLLDLPSVVTVEQITLKATKLKAVWQRHAALTATVETNRRFSRTKEVLMRHFQTQMREIPEDELATLGNRELVIKLFSDLLDTVRESEMSDLYTLCLKLVCRSRFYRTDAERILFGIERIKRENPHIDVREAAAVSIIEYIAYWAAAQFKVIGI